MGKSMKFEKKKQCNSAKVGKIQENFIMDSETEKQPLSPEEKIRKLEAQVTQLKNCIKKMTGQEVDSNSKKSRKKSWNFDFNLYYKRHVALHVCYFGWNYHGFAVQ